MTEKICPDSLVTLHYRLTTADDIELVSTFGSTPATLQLGSGELAPPLERCLNEVSVGERRCFVLEPDQAFGRHNPDFVQRLARSEIPESIPVEPNALVEFPTPNGGRVAGCIREVEPGAVLIDFNHPLAGKTLHFEVEVVGILQV